MKDIGASHPPGSLMMRLPGCELRNFRITIVGSSEKHPPGLNHSTVVLVVYLVLPEKQHMNFLQHHCLGLPEHRFWVLCNRILWDCQNITSEIAATSSFRIARTSCPRSLQRHRLGLPEHRFWGWLRHHNLHRRNTSIARGRVSLMRSFCRRNGTRLLCTERREMR